ncbi:MAG: ribosome maturation factor RimM [Alphaproteobacteria bacterium]|nr:ribosome maturation factor RimM [Alphaproteobacteria bacterium]
MPASAPETARDRVCVGQFAGAHGVRGLVRIRSFTQEPLHVAAYGPVEDEAGARSFRITAKSMAKGAVIAEVEGVADRDAAQLLNGTRLYVSRDRLPPIEEADEFYQADLIGCAAFDKDGNELGSVHAVHDFGAGILLELRRKGAEALLLPFTEEAVPEVDVAARRIIVDPPAMVGEQGDAA